MSLRDLRRGVSSGLLSRPERLHLFLPAAAAALCCHASAYFAASCASRSARSSLTFFISLYLALPYNNFLGVLRTPCYEADRNAHRPCLAGALMAPIAVFVIVFAALSTYFLGNGTEGIGPDTADAMPAAFAAA